MRGALIDRRTAIKSTAAAIAGLVLPRCRTVAPSATKPRDLAPVAVSESRIIRSIAGLRPFRRQGFRVGVERLDEKVLIHNYGHGGCGVTLSWGTADLATAYALEQTDRNAAVIGCGAVGLAAARLLQDRGFNVVIYARELPPATTSNIAGALWCPVTVVDRDQQTADFGRQLGHATRFAHRYFQTFVGGPYGVTWVRSYFYNDEAKLSDDWVWSTAPELFRATTFGPGQHPFPARFAHEFQFMLIEPAIYLRRLLSDFREAGGRVIVRSFGDKAALAALPESVIVNCTGLGAHTLVADNDVIPIKGQLTFLLPQEEVNYAYASLIDDIYMFSRRDGVLLGGTHDRGAWSTDVDPKQVDRMMAGHRSIADAVSRLR